MTGCNLEARLYSLKAFLFSTGFKGPSTCSWQLYQLHPPSFFKKSLKNQPTGNSSRVHLDGVVMVMET